MNKENLIAQYFSKSLSIDAQREFDHLMATDSEFAKDVAFQNNLKTAIKKEEQDALKKELQDFETEENSPSFNYKKWLFAASVAALLALTGFWYFGESNISNEQLFANNFEPYDNVSYPIVRGENSNDLKAQAFIAYEARNYKKALTTFNMLLLENDDAAISFYKANVLLQLAKTDEAIAILSNNPDAPEMLKAQQQWYLALAYVKIASNDKATTTLKALIKDGTHKKKEAEQLLKQLSSN